MDPTAAKLALAQDLEYLDSIQVEYESLDTSHSDDKEQRDILSTNDDKATSITLGWLTNLIAIVVDRSHLTNFKLLLNQQHQLSSSYNSLLLKMSQSSYGTLSELPEISQLFPMKTLILGSPSTVCFCYQVSNCVMRWYYSHNLTIRNENIMDVPMQIRCIGQSISGPSLVLNNNPIQHVRIIKKQEPALLPQWLNKDLLFKMGAMIQSAIPDDPNDKVVLFTNGAYNLTHKRIRIRLESDENQFHCPYRFQLLSTEIITTKAAILNIFDELLGASTAKYLLYVLAKSLDANTGNTTIHIWNNISPETHEFITYLIKATLGNYYDSMNVNYLASTKIKTTAISSDANLAATCNKRLIITTQPSDAISLKSQRLKQITSATPVSCKSTYAKEAMMFVPSFHLIIPANHQVTIDTSFSDSNCKLIPIEFNSSNTITDAITSFVKSEYDSIAFFHLLLEHYYITEPVYVANSALVNRSIVAHDTDDKFSIDKFISEVCVIDPAYFITSSKLYKAYKEYFNTTNTNKSTCSKSNKQSVTKKQFRPTLDSKGFTYKRSNIARGFQGLKLKSDITSKANCNSTSVSDNLPNPQ